MSNELATCAQTMPVALPIGTVIGRKYRIDQVIAEGGMGIVYKGWHLVLQHPIAIKVVRPEFAFHPEAAARFVNEARASAQLHSIHAAHVLDLGRIDHGPPVMVLEYLEGSDLRNILAAEGKLSLSRAVDYVLQVCEAMAEAHAQGIVHRDIKPENLILSRVPDGTEIVKVIDFGISKRIDSKGRSYTRSQSFGSPDYMAPEQMSTPERVDTRSDIWSIGIVLFELLTNGVPFRGETVHATCANVMCDEPIPLRSLRPDAPVAIEYIILRCLQKNPDQRYPSVRALARELAPFASPEWSQTDGRVHRMLTASDPVLESPSSSMRLLSLDEPDERPRLTPARQPEPGDLRVPMQPLWPHLLSLAAIVGLITVLVASRSLERVMSETSGLTRSSVAVGAEKVRAGITAATRRLYRARDSASSSSNEAPPIATALVHVRSPSAMSAAQNASRSVKRPERLPSDPHAVSDSGSSAMVLGSGTTQIVPASAAIRDTMPESAYGDLSHGQAIDQELD